MWIIDLMISRDEIRDANESTLLKKVWFLVTSVFDFWNANVLSQKMNASEIYIIQGIGFWERNHEPKNIGRREK